MIRAFILGLCCLATVACQKEFDQAKAEAEITAAAIPVGKREASISRTTAPGAIALETEQLREERAKLDELVERYSKDFPSAKSFADNQVRRSRSSESIDHARAELEGRSE